MLMDLSHHAEAPAVAVVQTMQMAHRGLWGSEQLPTAPAAASPALWRGDAVSAKPVAPPPRKFTQARLSCGNMHNELITGTDMIVRADELGNFNVPEDYVPHWGTIYMRWDVIGDPPVPAPSLIIISPPAPPGQDYYDPERDGYPEGTPYPN